MKASLQIMIFVGLLSSLMGCFLGIESCPEDQKIGQLRLTNPTFSPYRGNEVLTFSNQSGNQLRLTNFEYATLSTEQRLVVSTPCYKSDWNKQVIYYDSPRIFVSYRQSKSDYLNTIDYSFGIQDLRVDQSTSDTLLAEDLTIYNNFNRPSSGLRVLVSDRGNRARFDSIRGQYPQLIQYRLIADTVLNGRPYKRIYCLKVSPTLFFTKSEGIIAFKDQQDWWYRTP
jgi:hypothetical protein